MKSVALLSVVTSIVVVGLCVHLTGRIWSRERLFLLHLGRELTEQDRARSRRVVAVNAASCLLGVGLALGGEPRWALGLAATFLPLLPAFWLLGEMIALVRTLPAQRDPARYLVPLGPSPSALSYLSLPLQIASLAVGLVAATLFLGWRERLPARVPLHWNALGEVDRWGRPAELWTLGALMIVNLGIGWLVAWTVARERWALPPADPERYRGLQRRRRVLIVRLVEWVVLGANLGLGASWVALSVASLPGQGAWLAPGIGISLLITAIGVIGPVVAFFRPLIRARDELRAIAGSDVLGTRPDGWRYGGLIYYAPEDPAIFVPKRLGIGQTLNFARLGAWIFLAAMVGVPLALSAVAARVLGH